MTRLATLSAAALADMTGIEAQGQFVILAEITLADDAGTVIRIARWYDDFVFESNTFTRFPFYPEPRIDESTGAQNEFNVRVANPDRVLMPYLEAGNGGSGATVRILVVHSDNENTSTSELDDLYDVLGCAVNSVWATFSLGSANLMMREIGRKIYAQNCEWIFEDTRCAYSGAETVCTRKYEYCVFLDNNVRVGCYPGMTVSGIYRIGG